MQHDRMIYAEYYKSGIAYFEMRHTISIAENVK